MAEQQLFLYSIFQQTNTMKKQTKFTNFTFPKLKPTSVPVAKPIPQDHKYTITMAQGDKRTHPIYHFGSQRKLTNDQFQFYELPQSLSVLTYNIWFENHNKSARFECILRLLQASQADFICLQEVTQEFMQLLFTMPKESWVGGYYGSLFAMGWYDTLILSKYRCRFYKHAFEETGQGRSMLFAELVEHTGRNVVVGCMHYESLAGNEKLREYQIQCVQQATKKCERVIIVGDYNFSDFAAQNKAIDKSFTDVWLRVHKIGENGHTMSKTSQFNSWRPDHILYKAPSKVNLQSAQIYKIGEFSIPPFEGEDLRKIAIDNIVRTPSDHMGLIAWLPLK